MLHLLCHKRESNRPVQISAQSNKKNKTVQLHVVFLHTAYFREYIMYIECSGEDDGMYNIGSIGLGSAYQRKRRGQEYTTQNMEGSGVCSAESAGLKNMKHIGYKIQNTTKMTLPMTLYSWYKSLPSSYTTQHRSP